MIAAATAVLDTSVLVALLAREPAAGALAEAIDRIGARLVSVGTVLEASLVLQARHGPLGDVLLDDLLRELGADVVAMDAPQLALARDAARRFGRGRHPAALNFGDCFAYALARARGVPLLFTGGDFPRTDIVPVPY